MDKERAYSIARDVKNIYIDLEHFTSPFVRLAGEFEPDATADATVPNTGHEITDEYLNSSPVKELVEINGQKYEKREFVETLHGKKSTFIGKAVLGYDKLEYDIYPFDVLPHGITIKKGDTLRADWTILKKIN